MDEQTPDRLVLAIEALTRAVEKAGEKNAVALGRVEEQLDGVRHVLMDLNQTQMMR